MTDHYQRSQLLIDQGRYDLAEKELRQVLSVEPDFASAHGLLAVCLSEKKQYVEAIKEVGEAIALAPSRAGFHYIHAGVLQAQSELEAAKKVILEALRLDPENADYYARLASIKYVQHKYTEVLKSTEQGLRIDAEHVWCMNMRLLSLLALGRIAEAETEVNSTLTIAPDQYFPHTMKGWVMLHQNRIPEAMQSFREALRIEPRKEWARQGLLEALKARNGIYRFILRFELWISRLTTRQKIAFLALLIIPYLHILIILLILLALFLKPLFTLLFCFDPYGKLILTPKEINATKYIAISIATLLPGLLPSLITHQIIWLLITPTIVFPVYSFFRWRKTSEKEDFLIFTLWLFICIVVFILAIVFLTPESLIDHRSILLRGSYFIQGLVFSGILITTIGALLYNFIRFIDKSLAKQAIAFSRFLPQKQKASILNWLKPYKDIVLSEREKSDFNRAVFIFFSFIPGVPLLILTGQAGWLFIAPALFILIYNLRKLRHSGLSWKDKVLYIYFLLCSTIILVSGIALFLPLQSTVKAQLVLIDLLSIIFMTFCRVFAYTIYFAITELTKRLKV